MSVNAGLIHDRKVDMGRKLPRDLEGAPLTCVIIIYSIHTIYDYI